MKIAIIGIGNLLMGDEGIGVHAIELLRQSPPPSMDAIDLIDGGTGGTALLHILEDHERAIIIDAADFAGKPGEVKAFDLKDIDLAKDSAQVSLHALSLAGILELAKRLDKKLPHITLIAVQPEGIMPSTELSPACSASLPVIAEIIKDLV